MNIPAHVKIGAITWVIQLVPANELDTGDCGDCNHTTATIRINRDMASDIQEVTLLHELFHAINYEMEHSDVEMMSMVLHQVLKENELDFKASP